MEKEFWINKWKDNDIKFHQTEFNHVLTRYWEGFSKQYIQAAQYKVFIPLCGKTRDIFYFLELGLSVVGVELSEIAVKEIFIEIVENVFDTLYEIPNKGLKLKRKRLGQ